MRIDELHKFSDGTLNDVRNALDDRLKGIRMQYLPQTIWIKGGKDRAVAMIQAIDKMLKTRRIMRSLERFVGGRLTHVDPNLLNDCHMATNENGDDVPPTGGGDLLVPDLRTMEELCHQTLNGQGGPIALIAIQATSFGLKNDMIQQVQSSCQFY
nr:reverse transcriptase domain-containing protein [Tanacetum cinerariifolium]